MPAISNQNATRTLRPLLAPMESGPPTHAFHPGSDTSGHTESQPPQLPSSWENQENTERRDPEEDAELHELMEDIKRYIRNIDVGNL